MSIKQSISELSVTSRAIAQIESGQPIIVTLLPDQSRVIYEDTELGLNMLKIGLFNSDMDVAWYIDPAANMLHIIPKTNKAPENLSPWEYA